MVTNVATGQAFTDWLDIYDNAGNTNEDINETDDRSTTTFAEGENADPNLVMDLLIKFPFLAAFFGHYKPNGNIAVSVIHHVCKKGPLGIDYDGNIHLAHGIVNGLFPSKVYELPSTVFVSDPDPTELIFTPILEDFIDSAGDKAKIMAFIPTTVTAAMATAGVDANGHPLPQIAPRKCGVVPPFLVKAFLASDDPLTVLSDCVKMIETFAVANIAAANHGAWWQSCFPTLQRLWYLIEVPANPVKPSVLIQPDLTATSEDWILKKFQADDNLFFGINPAAMMAMNLPPLPPPMHPETQRILLNNSDIMARLAEIQQEQGMSAGSDGNARTKFQKRFHSQQQNFILFASSSSDTELLEVEPNSEFKQFVESPKLQALSLAQYAITQARGGTQTVDNAVAMMLHNATFLDSEAQGSGQSKGLSIFFMVPAPHVHVNQQTMNEQEVELRTATNTLTSAQIVKLTASQVRIPKDEHGFKATLENFLIVIDFVFSKNSVIYKALEVLQRQIIKCNREFSSMAEADPRFIATFMASIDLRVQKFLGSCAKAKTSTEAAYHYLDFNREVDDFLFQRKASVHLSYAVEQLLQVQVEATKSPKKTAGDTRAGSPTAHERMTSAEKKRARWEKAQGSIKNTSPVDKSWIKAGENTTLFHKHMSQAPKLRGEQICLKFHVQGSCPYGENCARKNTHTSDFDDATRNAYGSWVKKCREKSVQQD